MQLNIVRQRLLLVKKHTESGVSYDGYSWPGTVVMRLCSSSVVTQTGGSRVIVGVLDVTNINTRA